MDANLKDVNVGKNCEFIGKVCFGSEPYLITIGDNTTISFDTVFVTHDASTRVIRNLPDGNKETVIYKPIKVGKNCFVGCRSIILPGVTIGDNAIIGAGSLVNKDIPANSVAAGVPCKVICSLDEYREKHKDDFLYMVSLPYNEKKEYLLDHFNSKKSEEKMQTESIEPVNTVTEDITVSFTSYKERLRVCPQVIESILNQTLKPTRICLTLFKDDVQYIPEDLQKLIDDGAVELITCEEDICCHKKYFYAMQKYSDSLFITIDDDIIYEPDTIESLYNSYLKNPDCVSARRVHMMRYRSNGQPLPYNQWGLECKDIKVPSKDLFFITGFGVLFPPKMITLNESNLDEIRDTKTSDSVYLNYLYRKNGVKTKWAKNNKVKGTPIKDEDIQKKRLTLINTEAKKPMNDVYLKKYVLAKDSTYKAEKEIIEIVEEPVIEEEPQETYKKVVYTCISGAYDKLEDPKFVNKDFDYVCFTDQPFKSNVWQIRPIPEELKNLSQVKRQRYLKIMPHKYFSEYDFSMWIDANIEIRSDLNTYISQKCKKRDGTIIIGKHPARTCIYEEMKACLSLKKDKKENMQPQIDRYQKEGFPKRYGLPQSGIIFRYHNDEGCIQVMEDWWKEVKQGSHRDQLSFSYVCWKHKDVKIHYLEKSLFNCKWFRLKPGHAKNAKK